MDITTLQNTGLGTMAELYAAASCYPSSEHAGILLIRSHIAYWAGEAAAARAAIRASRGHSFRVARWGQHGKDDLIVRITDHHDHREGVQGYR